MKRSRSRFFNFSIGAVFVATIASSLAIIENCFSDPVSAEVPAAIPESIIFNPPEIKLDDDDFRWLADREKLKREMKKLFFEHQKQLAELATLRASLEIAESRNEIMRRVYSDKNVELQKQLDALQKVPTRDEVLNEELKRFGEPLPVPREIR